MPTPTNHPTPTDPDSIAQFQLDALADYAWRFAPPQHTHGVWRAVESMHRCNGLLWDQVNRSRCANIEPVAIAARRRAIARLTHQRDVEIAAFDDALFVRSRPSRDNAAVRIETPGMIVDRLSLNALVLVDMHAQTQRSGLAGKHLAQCAALVDQLDDERTALKRALALLLDDIERGSCVFSVRRVPRAANDPSALNPWLVGPARAIR